MPILPETWQASQASIAAAVKKPYLHPEEVSVGRRYAAELDDAVRRYGVGVYFHEAADPAFATTSPITTADQARAFVESLRGQLNLHFASYAAHWRPTVRSVTSDPNAYVVANAIKASFNLHRIDPSVHFNDDATNAVSAADATDDGSLVTLAEALRVSTLAHIRKAGKIVFVRSTAASSDAAYQQQLWDYNQRQANDLKIVAYAERVARAAAITLSYSYSGAGFDHERTPFTRLAVSLGNASKINDRLMNIWEAGTFNSNRYVLDVVLRASALLSGVGPTAPPTPPGQNATTTSVEGTISPAAEASLSAVITAANQFSAAAAVE
ncbi:MAG TPA: hypothetical protein VHP33_28115 [Polyangiaceae bacterium]|nr:hypothetical protein [Polyangiaceae bacterium]